MRITTGMVRRNYMSGLSASLLDMNNSRNTLQTGRRFNRVSEDPFRASSAAALERKYLRNKDYLDTITELQSLSDSQEDAVGQISDIAETVSKDYSVSAMNGVSGKDGRQSYATALRELQESVVSSLNAQYGDRFVLAGNEALKAPFELKDGKLYYRGLDVSDPKNQQQLEDLSKEASYVDIGFGLSFENNTNNVVSSTAYDMALSGLNLVGFGQTADGTEKNMVVLMGQMADVLEKENFDEEAYAKLWNQFQKGADELVDVNAKLGIRSKSLETTKTRLSDMDLAMTEQLDALVNVDPAEAIMNYSYAQYTYTSALKIGSGILGQSLLDFIN